MAALNDFLKNLARKEMAAGAPACFVIVSEENDAGAMRQPAPAARPPWTDGSLLPLSRCRVLRGSSASAETGVRHRKAHQLDFKSGAGFREEVSSRQQGCPILKRQQAAVSPRGFALFP
jgi:hypothetical protein